MASEMLGKKILVVCPASLKRNWQREFNFWAPSKTVQVIDGDRRARKSQLASKNDVYILNWELVRLKDEGVFYVLNMLKKMKFDVVIMDEAHKLKNRKSQTSKSCKDLAKAIPNVILLTGTPFMNKPDELWSLLNILDSKKFSSYWKFVEEFCHLNFNGFAKEVGGLKFEKKESLKKLLAPHMLRRTKMKVLADMPEKMVQKIYLPLDSNQKTIYKEMAKDMYTKINEEVVSASVVIAQITRLKQITIDPTLMLSPTDLSPLSGKKMEVILGIIEDLADKKVVIFSQFATACKRIHMTLQNAKYQGCILTGSNSSGERDYAVQKFQNDPDCQYLVVSTLAGGVGLTLTAASTAIFVDKYWTPAINSQAQDRLHRVGQKEPVTIIELLAEQTIEEGIEEMLTKKYDQFQALFSTDDFETLDSRSDIDITEIKNLLKFGIGSNI